MKQLVSSAWASLVAAGRTTKAGGLHGVKAMTRRAADFHWPPRQWKWRSAVSVAVVVAVTAVTLGVGPFAPNVPLARGSSLPVVNIPPPLLSVAQLNQAGGLFFATPAQHTALSDLQDQAITNTLADHGLPSSDANAVASWGRTDALAELWGLLDTAMTTAACSSTQTPGDSCRTTDQQNAVDWFSDVAYREGVKGANDAGLELVKWAGLGQGTYNNLVAAYDSDYLAGNDTTSDKTNLETFLKQASTPLNYNSNKADVATEGYCIYQSPYPYQSEYTSNIFLGGSAPADCFQGGNEFCFAGCVPPIPSSDQFEKWGAAVANTNITSNPSYAQTARDIALGLGLGGVAASVAVTAGLAFALDGVMTATATGAAIQAALFPFASQSALIFGTATAGGSEYVIGTAGALAAGGVAAIVGAVILFIAVTTVQAINLANLNDVPSQMAGYVEGVVGNTYDPASMLTTTDGAGELYSLFVDATLPPPPPASDTEALPFPDSACVGSFQDSSGYFRVCLDPPAPPAADPQTDPAFVVTPDGGTAGAPQRTLSWYDKGTKVSTTAYLHGTWFVNTFTTSDGTVPVVEDADGVVRPLIQSLRIPYTDWGGNEQTAFLLNIPGTGYEFVSENQQSDGTPLNPDTCVTDKTCVESTSLQYVDGNGNKFAASVIPAPVPTISHVSASANPTEGSPATLQATAASPVNAPLTYQWQIEDKPLATSFTICTDAHQQPIPCPAPTLTVTGNPATYTFPTSGTFAVRLTVTDPSGAFATSSFTLTVADVAPAVNLLLDCKPIFSVGCQSYTEPLGSATILGGGVTHVGSEDVETLHVNWGDNTADTISNVTCLGLLGCDLSSLNHLGFDIAAASTTDNKIYLPYTGTHTYAQPGQYTVTVKVTDQSNAVSTTTFTETVQKAATTTTLTSSPNPAVWGQSVTLTATVSSAYTVAKPTGTVEFKDGSSDIAGCGAQPVDTATETATCVTSALSVAGHSITAVYKGDSTFAGSTSATVSQPVNQAGTTTAVTSSGSPSTFGQSVTFTANVTAVAPGAGTPAGTVTFRDGATVLGTVILNGGTSTATFSTSGLGVGAHAITAVYNGDGNFLGSATSPLTQNVNTNISRYLQHGVYNLGNVNLSGGYFFGVNLTGANLTNGNFSGATFAGANLSGANLADGNFSGATFAGANLSGANLTKTNLKGATGLSSATLTSVIWSGTTCPDNTTSTSDGGSCVGHL